MACMICDVLEGKRKANVIYKDSQVIAFLAEEPAVVGHVIVAPNMHSPIFEGLDNDTTAAVFRVANRISAAVFESIGAKGTNLLVQNGIAAGQENPHFTVNIISRRDDDGLIFDWVPKQLSEEEMAAVELRMKKGLEEKQKIEPAVPAGQAPEGLKPEVREATTAAEGEPEEEKKEKSKEEENYLVRQLRRMP
jgi:histidine triad (HIT) family protein